MTGRSGIEGLLPSSLSGWALRVHQFRLVNGGTMNFLFCRWPGFNFCRPQMDRFLALHRIVNRADDPDVRQSFAAGGFRVPVVQNTIRKIKKLGSELVGFWENAFARGAAVHGNRQPQTLGEIVGGIGAQVSLGADDLKFGDAGRSEAASERRQARLWKAENRRDTFFHLAEALI